MEVKVLDKVFDEWNRGCVPFLDKLWKKIDGGLIEGPYISDGKILINHIDGIPREIVLNDYTDSIGNDNTLAIYQEIEGYKIGKSYNVSFIKSTNDFNVKFTALKKGKGDIMISRKYVGYAAAFEIRDIKDKNHYFRIEFQDNEKTLCNESMFIDKLLDIKMDSKIEDVYQIICDIVLNYRNYSKIIMEKMFYKNTSSFEKKILGLIVLVNGELQKMVTDRELGDSIISFEYNLNNESCFSCKVGKGMKLDDLYELVGYAKKLMYK